MDEQGNHETGRDLPRTGRSADAPLIGGVCGDRPVWCVVHDFSQDFIKRVCARIDYIIIGQDGRNQFTCKPCGAGEFAQKVLPKARRRALPHEGVEQAAELQEKS